MDTSLRTTGLIKSDSVKLVSLAKPTVQNLSDFKISVDNALTIKWAEYPDKNKLDTASSVKDISLKNASGEVVIAATGTCLFDYTKLYGPIRYMADVTVGGKTEHVVSKDNKYDMTLHASPGDKVKVEGYYAYENGSFTSNKLSDEATITETITIPSKGSSYSTVESFANRYSFVTLKTEATDNTSLINTFKVVDQNNTELTPGQSITVSNSSFKVTIIYYVEKEHTLSLIPTVSGDGKTMTIAVQSDSPLTSWTVSTSDSGLSFSDLGLAPLTISIVGTPSVTSFSVTAKTQYKEATMTVYVINNEDSYTLSTTN